jgi:1,4-alpha-glucan branching enzyme
MREYVRALNIFYLSSPELWEMDFDSNGFEWILADEAEKCTVAFRRISSDGSSLIVIINFSDSDQHVRIPSVDCKSLDIVFSTRPDSSPNKYEVEENEDGAHADIKIGRFGGVIIKENDGYIKIKT